MLEPGGVSRMIESAVTLLPEPDSPTTATVSFGAMSKVRPFTTWRHRPSTRNEVFRSRMERMGVVMLSAFGGSRGSDHATGVERIAQTIADEVDRQDGEEDCSAGK